MKMIALVLGVLAALLGGLWLSQGLGLVRIDPVACVGECTPLEGPSLQWSFIGAAVLAAGLFGVFYGLRRSR
jgi:hypothetical protein